MRVAIVGFGYVGGCLGGVLAAGGCEVVGIDRDRTVVDAVERGLAPVPEPGLDALLRAARARGRLQVTCDPAAVADAEVVLITVGTPLHADGGIDESALLSACKSIAGHLHRGQLVIVKSTVTPGTTRGRIAAALAASGLVAGNDFRLSYCPERLAEGTALAELRSLPMIVSGLTGECVRSAEGFWQDWLGVATRRMASLEAAEMVKLLTNWWIDANIAVANEMARYCDLYGTDVIDVIAAANDLPKGGSHVNILLPSVGVGGSCLTKDPWIAWTNANQRHLALHSVETARAINDAMPRYAVDRITAACGTPGTIGVLGLAFKNGTGDVRSSPAVEAVRYLLRDGWRVRAFDPLVDPAELPAEVRAVQVHALREALSDADCIAFLTGHEEFLGIEARDVASAANPGCLVFDGRRYFTRDEIAQLHAEGLRYAGVGRS